MLMPKKVKHRKQHRGRTTGMAKGGTEVSFGEYGIQALEPGWITARQIEAARIAMTRHIKRGGKVWINVFPDKPVTAEARRDPHGLRQGQPGALGRRRQARPHHVRAQLPRRRSREGGHGARHPEAADQGQVRDPRRRASDGQGAPDLDELGDAELRREARRGEGRSCSTCASSTPPDSSRTTPGSAHGPAGRSPGSTPSCAAREIAAAEALAAQEEKA